MFNPCTVRNKRSTLRDIAPKESNTSVPKIPLPASRFKTKHIDALCTLMHLCLLREDYHRAFHAFSLLLRSKGVDICKLWNIGLEILNQIKPDASTEYLERLIARFPANPNKNRTQRSLTSEQFFPAYILLLIQRQEYQRAMNALNEYMLSPPFNQNKALYEYSGMLCFELAKNETSDDERDQWLQKAKQNLHDAGINLEL
ncbi:RNA polymerase I transcription factor subunit Rrn11 [Schizosaccharomyces cryophilus OY26]|uniref:RNA polymerase I transcription factor subunit Rrn11 n=1 Tax=Schizosaccharomyces cryophilus (strain OY26 / ATCC MYA-4695 / CBS 11777 / NBRC 106824 / NRRL Y48691) TaxID=653667 RepID=S9VN20_SCHCR|nr:RNA polymerase I transcription factor subunit Rrn11 [Schizosaccharomyces cryophilus OY26]EPY49328.1 RNA polymerase I transcription factor subunit Rrn11 [Schizosaccharomyces cryophilus OY26]